MPVTPPQRAMRLVRCDLPMLAARARSGFWEDLVHNICRDSVKADQPAVPQVLLFTCLEEECDSSCLQGNTNISKRTGSSLAVTSASFMNTSGDASHLGPWTCKWVKRTTPPASPVGAASCLQTPLGGSGTWEAWGEAIPVKTEGEKDME